MLVSDGLLSFVIFHYADGGIQWTTGDNSGGAGGLGGTPALAGVNAGDGIRSETVGGSRTRAIVNITKTSNVKISGMWVFQVNRAENRDSSTLITEQSHIIDLEPCIASYNNFLVLEFQACVVTKKYFLTVSPTTGQ